MLIAGVDEVGRGPLAGPVVAAAVLVDNPLWTIEGIKDSKKLSPKKRIYFEQQIKSSVISWAVACASIEEIDELNILNASLLAMRRAIEGLSSYPQKALIDGNKIPLGLHCESEAVISGDDLIPCISAASILAKEYRDRLMIEMDDEYPQYGFAGHKGYPTAKHMQALKEYGICPHHRRSFAPVARLLKSES